MKVLSYVEKVKEWLTTPEKKQLRGGKLSNGQQRYSTSMQKNCQDKDTISISSFEDNHLTLSTSLKTLRKFSPASFLRSSSDHRPDARRLTKSAG